MTEVWYRLFGLNIRAGRLVPGLEPAPRGGSPDVTIEFSGQADSWPSIPNSAWVPAAPPLPVWRAESKEGSYTFLAYGLREGGIESCSGFMVDPAGTRVWCGWTPDVTLTGVAPLLLGSVLGCVLRRRGRVILHGSAVAVDGRAIALVGGRGAGKSTTAYALVREGATLVADDLTVLVDGDGPPRIEGGDSRVRLNLDAAALNGESLNGASGDHEALEREHAWPPLDKREVPLPTHRADSLPLSAIYVLGSREPEGVTEVTEEAPPLALTSLMSNRYATYILGPSDHARDFAALARLAGQVPVYRVRRTDSLDDLPGLARTLLQHARQVPAV